MHFGYTAMIVMLSIVRVDCYNQRYFNPQMKKSFVDPRKIKVTKPHSHSKGPRSKLLYKSEYVDKESRYPDDANDSDDDLPLWTELLEVKR